MTRGPSPTSPRAKGTARQGTPAPTQQAAAPAKPASTPPRKQSYRWVLVLIALAVVVSILLVYAENRVYNPATPFAGGTGDHVHAFALDPMQARHYYVGTHYGFFRTRDGGQSWDSLKGQGGLSATLVATSVSISPIDGRTVYVTGYRLDTGNPTGLAVTHDDGAHWQTLPTGGANHLPDPRILFVAAGWAQAGEVFAYALDTGLYRSLDGGQTWHNVAPPFTGQVTTFVPMLDCGTTAQPALTGTACPERLLVGTTQGLFAAPDATTASIAFAPVAGITGYVYSIAPHRPAPWSAYISTQQGIFHASAPLGPYTATASTANGAPTLTNLAISGGDPNTLFGVTSTNIVVTSRDGGQTWDAKGNGQLTRGISQLQSGLRSATGNNAPQWAGGQNIFLTVLQAPASSGTTVYAAISFPVQLFQSSDGGHLWDELGQG